VDVFAVDLDFSVRLERAEHRRGIRGEEVPMSERSEFGTVPCFTEKRRVQVRSTGSRPAERFFWLLFFAYKEK